MFPSPRLSTSFLSGRSKTCLMASAELREELNNLRNRIADNGEQAEAMRILAPDLWARVMAVLAVWAVERFDQDRGT